MEVASAVDPEMLGVAFGDHDERVTQVVRKPVTTSLIVGSNATTSAGQAVARMTPYVVLKRGLEVDDARRIDGLASTNSETGGLSWCLSSEIESMSDDRTWAVIPGGDEHKLGPKITLDDLDDEGGTALRQMVTFADYPGRDDDFNYVVLRKAVIIFASSRPHGATRLRCAGSGARIWWITSLPGAGGCAPETLGD